jgi:hypothetical protein
MNGGYKCKIVLLYIMKAWRGSRGITAIIINLEAGGRGAVSFTPRPLYSWKMTPRTHNTVLYLLPLANVQLLWFSSFVTNSLNFTTRSCTVTLPECANSLLENSLVCFKIFKQFVIQYLRDQIRLFIVATEESCYRLTRK